MKGVAHVDAVPPAAFDREVDYVPGVGLCAGRFEHMRERHPGPLGDVRPSFLASELRNLIARGIAPELRKRVCAGPINQAIDGEGPVLKPSGLEVQEGLTGWRNLVGEWPSGNLAAREFARERVSGDQLVGGVVQCFTDTP